jgi:hypothetical protein
VSRLEWRSRGNRGMPLTRVRLSFSVFVGYNTGFCFLDFWSDGLQEMQASGVVGKQSRLFKTLGLLCRLLAREAATSSSSGGASSRRPTRPRLQRSTGRLAGPPMKRAYRYEPESLFEHSFGHQVSRPAKGCKGVPGHWLGRL